MVGDRAPLSRQAASMASRSRGPPFSGFGLPATGPDDSLPRGQDLLIIPHLQGRWHPDMIFQNPMFSRPKLAFGPCGPLPPSYMSLNHRNIADV